MKIRIKRVDNSERKDDEINAYHNVASSLYNDEWKELKRLFDKYNPYISVMPVRQKYRVADFNRIIMLLGMERIDNMTEEELKEIGL